MCVNVWRHGNAVVYCLSSASGGDHVSDGDEVNHGDDDQNGHGDDLDDHDDNLDDHDDYLDDSDDDSQGYAVAVCCNCEQMSRALRVS